MTRKKRVATQIGLSSNAQWIGVDRDTPGMSESAGHLQSFTSGCDPQEFNVVGSYMG